MSYAMTVRISQPILLLQLLLSAALAGCAGAGRPGPTAPDEAATRRAALAGLTVENMTGRPLLIAFRRAAAPGGEIVVGRVAATATAHMAPIPAGEPIILIARDEEGAELALPPRSFRIGAGWNWVISAADRFTPPEAPEP